VDAWRAFRTSVGGFLLEEYRDHYDRLAAAHPEAALGNEPDDPGGETCTFIAGKQAATAVFERLAVTESQIYRLGLPTRPTKQSDTRARGFGGGSVEVDAIPPTVLRQIVEDAITRHIDPDALRVTRIAEETERRMLTGMIGGAT
jgi:hypothetical protein